MSARPTTRRCAPACALASLGRLRSTAVERCAARSPVWVLAARVVYVETVGTAEPRAGLKRRRRDNTCVRLEQQLKLDGWEGPLGGPRHQHAGERRRSRDRATGCPPFSVLSPGQEASTWADRNDVGRRLSPSNMSVASIEIDEPVDALEQGPRPSARSATRAFLNSARARPNSFLCPRTHICFSAAAGLRPLAPIFLWADRSQVHRRRGEQPRLTVMPWDLSGRRAHAMEMIAHEEKITNAHAERHAAHA